MTSKEEDRRVRKIIKLFYDRKITAEECRNRIQNIFDEPTLEEFFKKE